MKKTRLIIALMLVMFLAAVEGTIVTMATPTIAKDLQGLEMISFVFSVYLLTSAISTPIYGKLADLYGRKHVLSFGILLFLIGSFLCGLSQTMVMLIAFRAIQGLGAGAIFTVSYTIIGDVFPVEERTKIQGGLGTVWGVASLVGPFFGGFLIDVLSWHWIFFINIPFGLLSIFLLQSSFEESYEKKKHRIDYTGTVTLSLAMISFLSIFLFNQTSGAGKVIIPVVLTVITLVLLFIFYMTERRVKEPIMPFDIFTKTSIIVNVLSFIISAILIGINVYIPIYVQNILGMRPMISGLLMLPMSISWLAASLILGNLYVKYGGKAVTLLSNIILLISTVLLLTLGVKSPIVLIIIYNFILGVAFGGSTTALTIMVQDSVDYSKRGSAVGANSLIRTLGQTIAIGIFGNVFNTFITRYFVHKGVEGVSLSSLYQTSSTLNHVTPDLIRISQSYSMHVLFASFIILSVITLLLTFLMPGMNKSRKND